jgi:hypothetical protein
MSFSIDSKSPTSTISSINAFKAITPQNQQSTRVTSSTFEAPNVPAIPINQSLTKVLKAQIELAKATKQVNDFLQKGTPIEFGQQIATLSETGGHSIVYSLSTTDYTEKAQQLALTSPQEAIKYVASTSQKLSDQNDAAIAEIRAKSEAKNLQTQSQVVTNLNKTLSPGSTISLLA